MRPVNFWRVVFAERIRSRAGILGKLTLLVALFFIDYYGIASHLPLSGQLLTLGLYYVGISILGSWIRILLLNQYLRRNNLLATHVDNFTIGIKRIVSIIVHLVFLGVFFSMLGIQITQFFTSISLFAVALTLIFKEYITNFLSGANVLLGTRFSINDYIKVGDVKGRITDINFSSIELLTESGDVAYIPNMVLLGKEVTNFSKKKQKVIVEEYVFKTLHEKQFISLEKKIQDIIQKEVSSAKAVSLSIQKIEKDSITIKISVTLTPYRFETEQTVKRIVASHVLACKNKIDEAKQESPEKV